MRTFLLMFFIFFCQNIFAIDHVKSDDWRIERARRLSDTSALAVTFDEHLLAWVKQNTPSAAEGVYLVIDAPFDQVQTVVQTALAQAGKFISFQNDIAIANLDREWAPALLSHRADLREALAHHFADPKVEKSYQEGEITAAEMKQQKLEARAFNDSPYDNSIYSGTGCSEHIPLCQTVFKEHQLWQRRIFDISNDRLSTLKIVISDFSYIFNRATTAIFVQRRDTYTNPKHSQLRELFKPFFGGREIFTHTVVPAEIFKKIRAAIVSSTKKEPIITPSPLIFIKAPASIPLPVFNFVTPEKSVVALVPTMIDWTKVKGVPPNRQLLDSDFMAVDFLPLRDRDILILASVLDKQLLSSKQLMRLHKTADLWEVQLLWKGHDAQGLIASEDGKAVWFTETALRTDRPQQLCHELTSGITIIIQEETSAAGQGCSSRPPLKFSEEASPRENAGPVLWRSPHRRWIEDERALAEYNVHDHHLLRAIALPQRKGKPGTDRLYGKAPWAPTPLGSPESSWIGVGFTLRGYDDQFQPLPGNKGAMFDGGPGHSIVGMHIVDVKSNKVRFSALLGRASTLQAAARSSNGRMLALGANDERVVTLWDTEKATAPLKLSIQYDVDKLAFSWDGSELWATSDQKLFYWSLPKPLWDASRNGSFPDQSR